MKCILFLMTICFMTVLMVSAQTGNQQKRLMPDENTIFKDTAGKVITKEVFEKTMKEGNGRFGVIPLVQGDRLTEMQIKLMTEEEMKDRNEMMKKRQAEMKKNLSEIKGKQAPAFEGVDINGNKVSLNDLKGKVVVLKFWFTKCVPCLDEMPELNKMLAENYKDSKDVVFLAPCLDDKEEIKNTLKEHPFSYRSLSDMMEMANAYKITAYPTHIVIGKNGEVMFAATSGPTDVLKEAIDKALAK
jgi:peroxiredoxin